jgi:hypothetical protein
MRPPKKEILFQKLKSLPTNCTIIGFIGKKARIMPSSESF